MPTRLIAAALLLTAAGCNTLGIGKKDPAVVSATREQVTLSFEEGDMDATTQRAQDLCAKYGLNARLDHVAPGEEGERLAVFNCV